MDNQRSRTTSKEHFLRGVYEENKRIEDGTHSHNRRSNSTYATGIGGAVLLLVVLAVATNFALRDQTDGSQTSSSPNSPAAEKSGRLPAISPGVTSTATEAFNTESSGVDTNDAADALASSPIPLAELFHLNVRTVVIDAGHGGRDPGALGTAGLMEKDITLDVATRLARRLADRQGLRVALTRDEDETKSLKQRAEFANATGADLFVSIHVNQFPEEPVYALETYYFGRQSSPSVLRLAALENENSDYAVAEFNQMIQRIGDRVKLEESKRLAEHVQRSLFRNTRRLNEQVRNWGVKTAPFVVLVGAEAPGILAEIGVISNTEEEARLATPEYREKLALFLEEGIVTYLNERSDQETSQNGATENASEEEVDD